MDSEHLKYVQDTISGHSEAFWQKYTKIWDLTCLWGEVKANSHTGTTKISSNPIIFDAPQLLARWSTHPILLKNTLNHIITSGICLSYSVSHKKYKHRENQKLGFFRFFRNFRLILHGNEKKTFLQILCKKQDFCTLMHQNFSKNHPKSKIFSSEETSNLNESKYEI